LCVICPTAAAAAVITEKLGGNITSLTIYTIIATCVTSIMIPLFFPLVEPSANVPFLTMSGMILKRVFIVLIAPLALAFLTRKFANPLAIWVRKTKNLGYYLWCFNLTIVSGVTMHNILASTVSCFTLLALLISPLFISVIQFAIGKAVGKPYGDNITAGQALGQKNTVVGIWLTITFLNPLAAIAAGGYLVWQNIINALQIRYKEKYGYLKW
jgi:BASS family bile acid:Na+ symporter